MEVISRDAFGAVDHGVLANLYYAESRMNMAQKLDLRAQLEWHVMRVNAEQEDTYNQGDEDFVVINNAEDWLEMDFDEILSFGE